MGLGTGGGVAGSFSLYDNTQKGYLESLLQRARCREMNDQVMLCFYRVQGRGSKTLGFPTMLRTEK